VSTVAAPVEHLDLATAIEVSQAIAGEVVLEKLVDILMRTAIEHSGAQRGLLILPAGAERRITAEVTTNGATVIVQMCDEAPSSSVLPESVLDFVVRTGEPYIGRNDAHSMLCLPLSNRGTLIGMLYLETSLVPHVFAPARVAVLKLVASQAATSLENIWLYRGLAERESKFQRLVEANIAGIFMWDHGGQILDANDTFLHMLGYEREDVVAGRLRWTELTPRELLDREREQALAQLERDGSLPPFEWEYFHRDGTRMPVLLGLTRFGGGNENVGFVLDLTERKRVEQALRKSEWYLAEGQRLAHMGSWAFNHLTGKHTYYSDEAFRLFGLEPTPGRWPETEIIHGRIHPEEGPRILGELGGILGNNGEYNQEYRILLPDGTVKHLHSIGHPIRSSSGEVSEYFGTVIDVTERKRTEQGLLAQQRVTRILAEAATVEEAVPRVLEALCEHHEWHLGVMWRIDRDTHGLRCAELWSKPSLQAPQFEAATRSALFGSGSGLPGRVWASRRPALIPDIVSHPECHRADIAAREGLHSACAFPVLFASEVLGIIELVSREIRRPEQPMDDLMAAVGSQIGQFIDRKRAENALQLAQAELAHVTRVMSLGELAASIAHEVNQPLGAIVTSAASCARWLATSPPNMEKATRALQRIVNDGRRASEVIGRIRGLMKRQAPRKSRLDINEAILEVIALAQYQLRRDDILLETKLADGLPLIEGDRVQLQQVLLNLTVNAIEAMRGIDGRRRELTICSATDGLDAVSIEVCDTGTGLDLGRAAHLFEPFYTTKAEGIGIGLSISRSIVEAHGGDLSAAPNAPHGAVFRIALPVKERLP
jgi:PAS domain S-box-containing protein